MNERRRPPRPIPEPKPRNKMGESEREQPLVERLARHFPEGWTVTIEGGEVHIRDGESPPIWEAFIETEGRDEHEIVRQTIAALHRDLKCIPMDGGE